jgi:hypothetical protein
VILFFYVNGGSSVIAAIIGVIVLKKLSVKSICGMILTIGAPIIIKAL